MSLFLIQKEKQNIKKHHRFQNKPYTISLIKIMSSNNRPVYVPRQKRNNNNHGMNRKVTTNHRISSITSSTTTTTDSFRDGVGSKTEEVVIPPLSSTTIEQSSSSSSSHIMRKNNSKNVIINYEDHLTQDEIHHTSDIVMTNKAIRQRQSQNDKIDNMSTKQQIEDYMDEQDHNEWGGPKNLKKEYNNSSEKSDETSMLRSKISEPMEEHDDSMFGSILHQLLEIKVTSSNIGEQLLRKLGWKGSESMYAPHSIIQDGNIRSSTNIDGDDAHEQEQFLSDRNLRKIQLHSRAATIPIPKIDASGLGYSPFDNAPEFKAYKEKRMKASRGGNKSSNNNNSYRISDAIVHGKYDTTDIGDSSNNNTYQGNHNMMLEDDFIGKKAMNGFSYHDDADDDIYDNNSDIIVSSGDRRNIFSTIGVGSNNNNNQSITTLAIREDNDDDDDKKSKKNSSTIHIDVDNYDTVAYEHSDSDPEDMIMTTRNKPNNKSASGSSNFINLLSSWTSELKKPQEVEEIVTVDGHPIMSGFVLGTKNAIMTENSTSMKQNQQPIRFRGPDIPSGYEVRKHVFPDDENPSSIQWMMQIEKNNVQSSIHRNNINKKQNPIDTKDVVGDRESIGTNILASNKVSSGLDNNSVVVQQDPNNRGILNISNAFVGIASTMNSRFSSGDKTILNDHLPAGLYVNQKSSNSDDNNSKETKPLIENTSTDLIDDKTKSNEEPVRVKRTMMHFTPKPLLCKRLYVIPVSKFNGENSNADNIRSREETYFHDEILTRVTNAAANNIVNDVKSVNTVNETVSENYRLEAKRIVQALLSDTPFGDMIATDDDTTNSRPSLETYKSIFEPPPPPLTEKIVENLVHAKNDVDIKKSSSEMMQFHKTDFTGHAVGQHSSQVSSTGMDQVVRGSSNELTVNAATQHEDVVTEQQKQFSKNSDGTTYGQNHDEYQLSEEETNESDSTDKIKTDRDKKKKLRFKDDGSRKKHKKSYEREKKKKKQKKMKKSSKTASYH